MLTVGVAGLYSSQGRLHGKMSFEQKPEGNGGKLQIPGQRAFQEEAVVRSKVLR